MTRLLDIVQTSWLVSCEHCGAGLRLRAIGRGLVTAAYFAPELLVLFPVVYRVLGYQLAGTADAVLPPARVV